MRLDYLEHESVAYIGDLVVGLEGECFVESREIHCRWWSSLTLLRLLSLSLSVLGCHCCCCYEKEPPFLGLKGREVVKMIVGRLL